MPAIAAFIMPNGAGICHRLLTLLARSPFPFLYVFRFSTPLPLLWISFSLGLGVDNNYKPLIRDNVTSRRRRRLECRIWDASFLYRVFSLERPNLIASHSAPRPLIKLLVVPCCQFKPGFYYFAQILAIFHFYPISYYVKVEPFLLHKVLHRAG